ncbi:MAG: hypothetical protein HDS26_01835 [Bacteroides sp.]|nr:hypothetical protein [Bacteroides sp.]MBD5307213.1 hypothetical protein [Bacteroides sp.]
MPLYYLSIGSNCHGRRHNVQRALNRLETLLSAVSSSSVYETPDLYGGPALYMNAVVKCRCALTTSELESLAKRMEIEFGRDEKARLNGEVPLDIDVVICDGNILRLRDFEAEFFQIGYRELAPV